MFTLGCCQQWLAASAQGLTEGPKGSGRQDELSRKLLCVTVMEAGDVDCSRVKVRDALLG